MEIKAENLNRRTRLDSYISMVQPTLSRTTVKKLILSKVIKVNNEFPKFNKILVEGDLITFDEDALKNYISQSSLTEIKPVEMPIDIIFEDDSLIVVNKDEGIVVHPSYNHLTDTLMNGLTYYILNSKNPFVKVRPVNRLDKETSGIILFSKDLVTHNFYTRQFKKREVVKEYLAVVKGDFLEVIGNRNSIKVSGFIGKSPEGYVYRVSTDSVRDEYAETDIYFKEHIYKEEEVYSLLKVVPHTGRTHQIRVHLNSLRFPIVGDSIYGGEEYGRVLLHSQALKVKDPDGNILTFSADPKRWFN